MRSAYPGESGPGKLLSPLRRRHQCVEHIQRQLHVSERRACVSLDRHRSRRSATRHGAESHGAGFAGTVADTPEIGEERTVLQLRFDHDGVVVHERADMQQNAGDRQYADQPSHEHDLSLS